MQHIPRQTVNAWTEQKKKKLDPRRLIPALVHYHQQGKSTQVWIEYIIEAHHTRWSTTTTISPRLTPSPRSVTSVSLSSKRMIRSDEGLTSALDSFHGGQLTSLSQLIKPYYLSTQHHSSFRNLPCLDLWCLFTPLILTQTEEAIRYLEFCIERLGNRDQAIHNYLLSLYIEQEDDESLLRYLQMQGQVWY